MEYPKIQISLVLDNLVRDLGDRGGDSGGRARKREGGTNFRDPIKATDREWGVGGGRVAILCE